MSRKSSQPHTCRAHVGPPPAIRPALLDEVPLLIRLERETEEEFRKPMRLRLEEKIRQVDDSISGTAPRCDECGSHMKSRGRKNASFLSRFGKIDLRPRTYRCKPCKRRVRPLVDKLGVELGCVSGSLARLLALLGVVVPYELAARLTYLMFGVKVNAMTVWRAVQRLGEACEQYVEAQTRYHTDPNTQVSEPDSAPEAVVLGIDGCMLGMQVREHRRHRQSADEVLPELPPVEDGHFREVKTGVLLLPSQRTEPSPGRRSVIRRVLVTCLGNADLIFDRLWSKIQDLGWLGAKTVVVIVGDGAEWIWNRATMFARRCEILDFWHAIECAWKFARLRFGEKSKLAAKWVSRLADDLRAGKVESVIKRLRKIKTRSPEEQEKLDDLIRYYETNASRMRYDEYIRLGYGIGSGAVESSHKQVVHARLRQAGMRWSENGARRLLALRVLLLNDNWSMLDRLMMKPIAA